MSRATLAALTVAVAALTGCPWGSPPSPTPSTDPGFDSQAESRLIAQAVDSADLKPYFEPSRLVNDGIGIFSNDDDGTDELPRRWGRTYPKTVQSSSSDALTLQFVEDASYRLTAEATYSVERPARFVADFAWQSRLLTKAYTERATRLARFSKVNGAWRLVSLSPMVLEVPRGTVSLASITLTPEGGAARTLMPGSLVDAGVQLQLRARQRVTVSARLRSPVDPASCYFFMTLPPGRDRLQLHDDGLNGDSLADDGIYSATFTTPEATGDPAQAHHLVLDAVAASTFTDLAPNAYDAQLWGVSYLISGGDAR